MDRPTSSVETLGLREITSWYAEKADIQKCYKVTEMKFYINGPENNEGVIWKKKKDVNRFLSARRGNLITFPFQCDFCWAVNITGKEVSQFNQQHKVLMSSIHRVNLDMMWSKEPSTISSTMNNLVKARKNSARLGLDPVVIPQGPWEFKDNAGMQIAIEILIQ